MTRQSGFVKIYAGRDMGFQKLYFRPNWTTRASPGMPAAPWTVLITLPICGRIADVQSRRAQIDVIEEVEELGAKLDGVRFEEAEVLHGRGIHLIRDQADESGWRVALPNWPATGSEKALVLNQRSRVRWSRGSMASCPATAFTRDAMPVPVVSTTRDRVGSEARLLRNDGARTASRREQRARPRCDEVRNHGTS